MHQVTITRRITDPVWRTLRAIEAWLAENKIECERPRVLGLDHNTVGFRLSFAHPVQARHFSEAFGAE